MYGELENLPLRKGLDVCMPPPDLPADLSIYIPNPESPTSILCAQLIPGAHGKGVARNISAGLGMVIVSFIVPLGVSPVSR